VDETAYDIEYVFARGCKTRCPVMTVPLSALFPVADFPDHYLPDHA
jgi:hypothetical protein